MALLRNNSIWCAFYSKFATFRDFEINQFIFEKPIYFFFKKTQIWNILKNVTISVAFYGKFATIWSKNNFTFNSVNELADVA